MKNYLVLLLILASTSIHAQDKIITKASSVLEVKVTEIGENVVKYKRFSNQDGPVYSMPKKDIYTIWYENGEQESFENVPPQESFVEKQEEKKVEQKTLTLRAGTQIPLHNANYIRAANLTVGDAVNFRVARDVMVEGVNLIPYGSNVKGIVYERKKSSWFGTKGRLGIKIEQIEFPGGMTVPLSNGDVYVTGKNRTPLSVIVFLFVWPGCFITGSKAELPAGYEIVTNVSNDVKFIENNGYYQIDNTSLPVVTPSEQLMDDQQPLPHRANIIKRNGILIEVVIISVDKDTVSYRKPNKSNGKTYTIPRSKVARIDYK